MKTKKEQVPGKKGISKPFKRAYVHKRDKQIWKDLEDEYREYVEQHFGKS